MDIHVQQRERSGNICNEKFSISKIAFIKHLAIAGQHFMPSLKQVKRGIGMMLYFCDYFRQKEFDANHFSLPPKDVLDPTEQGQFSNHAGLAIADYLAKRIDKSSHTTIYEVAMREKKRTIQGRRPDLIAYNEKTKSSFAIEAKGLSKKSSGNMEKYKKQSRTGDIPVQFSVACVSYNLYKEVQCKYYDPVNNNTPFDDKLFKEITKKYYGGLMEFLTISSNYTSKKYFGADFYEIAISEILVKLFDKIHQKSTKDWIELFGEYQPKLILPKNIETYTLNGLDENFPELISDASHYENQRLYIDNDLVGLSINW
jgi:hypothetical protein